ncbi:TetR/AcrR family transcriptional regulator [Phenylobacterium sp. J367]|uniref:TetR/AcrR family transcriptional regulator n=1 Tax=Phenylobacterium sp. J367 TaxID=2898435 RepID=UPI002151F15E|nr:TetR/AcrR family transcriptional regulator [Phenylobacterium sp. J367]MCR5881068.1 TetR/AcrR family transcriptional regulator [Phenylobacterium sp. J367]
MTTVKRAARPGELEPRKWPRQARSQATFAAILDACARMLAQGPYDALTTNAIAERAGVSIGTLYEYFPNRESIVAALAAESCRRLVTRMEAAIVETIGMPPFDGVEHLIRVGVASLRAPENVFTVLIREAPFVLRLPAFQAAREALTELCQEIRVGSPTPLTLPEPQADTWLISQMLFSAMLEIAFIEGPGQPPVHAGDRAREADGPHGARLRSERPNPSGGRSPRGRRSRVFRAWLGECRLG